MEERLKKIDTLVLLVERISHLVRRHLGPPLTTLSDLSEGLEVSRDEAADGVRALGEIRRILDELRPLLSEAVDARKLGLLKLAEYGEPKISLEDALRSDHRLESIKLIVGIELLRRSEG